MSSPEGTPNETKTEGGAEPKQESVQLNLKVTDSTTEIFFKIKSHTPLRKVMDAFCKRTGKDPKALRFLYDGERVTESDTPASLDIQDGDMIEALNEQVGGC